MFRVGRIVFYLFVVFAMPLLYGADTARLSGIVQDQQGAVVPKARIVLTHEATGLQRDISSSETGEYLFLELPIGSYRLEVEAAGFRKYAQTGIVLSVNQSARNDVTLLLGDVAQEVTVREAARMVDTDISEVKYTMDQARIEDIPLVGRNVLALASLIPGVVSGGVPDGVDNATMLFVNGNRMGDNNFNMDGANMTDESNAHWANRYPPPDSIQEFTILTSGFKAEYGTGGVIINVSSKSGTNELHGSAWEFLRNNKLNAANFFGGPTANKYQFNQFGAAVGGPVIKNRTFFFVSYEGFRGRLGNSPLVNIVPTAAERGGDLSSINNQLVDPTTRQPFPGNIIPSSRLDPTVQNVLDKFVPLPNASLNQYIYLFPNHNYYDQGLFKVDHSLTEKSRLSVRGVTTPGGQLAPYVNMPGFMSTDNRPSENLIVSHTYVSSPTTLNEFRASAQRTLNILDVNQENPTTPQDLGFKIDQIPPTGILPSTTVAGYFTIGIDRANSKYLDGQKLGAQDSFTLVRGPHTIKIGGSYQRGRIGGWAGFGTNGVFNFSGNLTGNALGDFLLGSPSSFTQQTPVAWEFSNNDFALYAQDDFKVARKLTLNLGFRYEFASMPKEKDGQIAFYTPWNFAKGIRSTVFPTAPPGMLFVGDPGMPDSAGFNRWREWGELGPRFGFAYDVMGNGKIVLRGGAGIFVLPIDLQWEADSDYTPPFVLGVTLNYPSSYANPFQGRVDPFPSWRPKTPYDLSSVFPGFFLPNSLDYRNGYTEQWNYTVETQLRPDVKLSVSYVGNHGVALTDYQTFNAARYIPGTDARGNPLSTPANDDSRRPWAPYYTAGLLFETDGSRKSNQFQVMVQKRYSRGLTIMAHYSLSNSMSWCDNPDLNCGDQDPNNLRADYSPVNFDVRHRAVASWVYDIPKFTSNRRMGLLVNGWEFTGVVTLQSGMPFNVVSGLDNSLTGVGADRPNVVGNWKLPSGRSDGQKVAEYFNVNAFVPNNIGQFGNLGHNALRGPGFVGNDIGLFKKFEVTEKQHLEFRAEAFNLLNHVNLGQPDSSLVDTTFGQILSAGPARIVQLGLKYLF